MSSSASFVSRGCFIATLVLALGCWGKGGGAPATGIVRSEQNVLAALVAWVEEGKAPETNWGCEICR